MQPSNPSGQLINNNSSEQPRTPFKVINIITSSNNTNSKRTPSTLKHKSSDRKAKRNWSQ
jgi:hypothetical protein